MKRGSKIAFGIVAVFLVLISFVIAINFLNVPFPYLNPAQANTIERYPLTYGQPPGIFEASPNAMNILVTLNASGILVTQEPAIIQVQASVSRPTGLNITSMVVSFEGAIQYVPICSSSFCYIIPDYNESGAKATNSISCEVAVGIVPGNNYCGSSLIEWTAEGSYYPIVTFNFNNSSKPRTASFPDYFITVSSPQVLNDARYNRINEILTIALVGFAFVEGIKILYDFTQEDKPTLVIR